MMLANPRKSAILRIQVVPLAGLKPASDSRPLNLANLLKLATGNLRVPANLANRLALAPVVRSKGLTKGIGGARG